MPNVYIGANTPPPAVGSIHPLTLQEQAKYGATHRAIIRAGDITAGIANATALTLNIYAASATQFLEASRAVLVTPFVNAADAAQNTTAITVGDGGSANRYIQSMECNGNAATPVYVKAGTGLASGYQYTAADVLAGNNIVQIVFPAPAAGKSLSNLTAGELHVYLRITDPAQP